MLFFSLAAAGKGMGFGRCEILHGFCCDHQEALPEAFCPALQNLVTTWFCALTPVTRAWEWKFPLLFAPSALPFVNNRFPVLSPLLVKTLRVVFVSWSNSDMEWMMMNFIGALEDMESYEVTSPFWSQTLLPSSILKRRPPSILSHASLLCKTQAPSFSLRHSSLTTFSL